MNSMRKLLLAGVAILIGCAGFTFIEMNSTEITLSNKRTSLDSFLASKGIKKFHPPEGRVATELGVTNSELVQLLDVTRSKMLDLGTKTEEKANIVVNELVDLGFDNKAAIFSTAIFFYESILSERAGFSVSLEKRDSKLIDDIYLVNSGEKLSISKRIIELIQLNALDEIFVDSDQFASFLASDARAIGQR